MSREWVRKKGVRKFDRQKHGHEIFLKGRLKIEVATFERKNKCERERDRESFSSLKDEQTSWIHCRKGIFLN